jgi:hypothetical protein
MVSWLNSGVLGLIIKPNSSTPRIAGSPRRIEKRLIASVARNSPPHHRSDEGQRQPRVGRGWGKDRFDHRVVRVGLDGRCHGQQVVNRRRNQQERNTKVAVLGSVWRLSSHGLAQQPWSGLPLGPRSGSPAVIVTWIGAAPAPEMGGLNA